jgi:hypothetical protein
MDALSKQIGIPIYTGVTDAKDFIKAFKLQSICFGWNEAKQCEAIPFLLAGKAENLYEAVGDDDKKKINEVFKALTDGCVVSQEVLLDRFFERKPSGQELLSAYAISLQSLLKKAMPGLQVKEREILLRRQIGQYLPDHMRALIHFNAQKSWEELLTAIDQALPHAKALENGESVGLSQNFSYKSEAGGNIAVKVEPVDINTVSVGHNTTVFRGACNYCKEVGHRVADCDKARVANKRKESEARSSGGSAKTGSSRFDSSKQYSSSDSSYRSNKPRDYSEKYSSSSNRSGNGDRRSGKQVSSNNIEIYDSSEPDDDDCYDNQRGKH